jgi:hypothetical protein
LPKKSLRDEREETDRGSALKEKTSLRRMREKVHDVLLDGARVVLVVLQSLSDFGRIESGLDLEETVVKAFRDVVLLAWRSKARNGTS